jgi:hypothetical protein
LIELVQYKLYGFFRPIALFPLYLAHHNLIELQIARLFVVLLQAYLVFQLAHKLRATKATAALACATMLLHELCVAVYLQHDLWGDILGGLGLLLLILLVPKYCDNELSLATYAAAAVVISSIALGAKELGLLAPAVLLAAYVMFDRPSSKSRGKIFVALVISFVSAVYLIYRISLGAIATNDPSGYYTLSFGLIIPKNVALVAAGFLNPMNTVDVYLTGGWWRVTAALWIVLLTGITSWGIWQSERILPRRVFVLMFLGIGALGPVL